MRANQILLLVVCGFCLSTAASEIILKKPADPYFAEFSPIKPNAPAQHLRKNDRLAICGDSITEQKMYSRIMETYLTVCAPELNVSVRQYGWGGERAPGFLARMTNDCLRFKPTIATTCYGMNDHEYRPYEARIGRTYRESSTAIIRAFKAHGARVVMGSPGCVGRKDKWSMDALNLNLCQLRNIGVEIAETEKVGFADVFWPMLTAGYNANLKYGEDYAIPGKDAIHPEWAGHVVMAYVFLEALGLTGDIGTFTMDLQTNKTAKASVSKGHKLLSDGYGQMEIQSFRYPFVTGAEQTEKKAAKAAKEKKDEAGAKEKGKDETRDDNILSGTQWVPFYEKLNRLTLVVRSPQAPAYHVVWAGKTNDFSAEDLAKGINLAAEYRVNPFTDAFRKVDQAVADKQMFETKQIKKDFRSEDAKANFEEVLAKTEKERSALVAAIKDSFVPVTHTVALFPKQEHQALAKKSRKRK